MKEDASRDGGGDSDWMEELRIQMNKNQKVDASHQEYEKTFVTTLAHRSIGSLPLPMTLPKGLTEGGDSLTNSDSFNTNTKGNSLDDKYKIVTMIDCQNKHELTAFNDCVKLEPDTGLISFIDPDPRDLYLKSAIKDKNKDVDVETKGTDAHSLAWWGLQDSPDLKAHLYSKIHDDAAVTCYNGSSEQYYSQKKASTSEVVNDNSKGNGGNFHYAESISSVRAWRNQNTNINDIDRDAKFGRYRRRSRSHSRSDNQRYYMHNDNKRRNRCRSKDRSSRNVGRRRSRSRSRSGTRSRSRGRSNDRRDSCYRSRGRREERTWQRFRRA